MAMAPNPETWRVREVTKFHHDDQSTTLEALEIWSDSDLVCIDVDTEEHARLIAAAPDMLEALKLVMEEKAPRYHDCTDDGLPKCAWCFAEEALAKAEGRS